MDNTDEKNEQKYWLDQPRNILILLTSFYIILTILIIIDLSTHKHTNFSLEEWPAFYAVFGFISFTAIVLFAKHVLRKIVKRDEDYYNDRD